MFEQKTCYLKRCRYTENSDKTVFTPAFIKCLFTNKYDKRTSGIMIEDQSSNNLIYLHPLQAKWYQLKLRAQKSIF